MKIGIVSLGLIGGSIYKSLELLDKYELVAVSNSVKGNNISTDYSILKDCDVVFVCSPMNATLKVLDKLDVILQPNTIVTDVCSLKTFVSQKKYSFKFIPSHPMAGTENSGWDNSFAGLFKGAKWAITPINSVELDEQEILEKIITDLGAKIIITTPEEHDEAVALISHMPLILSQALCQNIKDNKLAQELASSGFKDMTRLALSNLEMAKDMLELNRENIVKALDLTEKSTQEIINNDYIKTSLEIKKFRKQLY